MRAVSVRKLVLVLALVMLVMAAVGASSHLVGACEYWFPGSAPC